MPKNTRWDRNLSVTPDAEGLIGHAQHAYHEDSLATESFALPELVESNA